MKILVTGSGGFIGKNMVAHLEKEHTTILYDIKDDTVHPEISGNEKLSSIYLRRYELYK